MLIEINTKCCRSHKGGRRILPSRSKQEDGNIDMQMMDGKKTRPGVLTCQSSEITNTASKRLLAVDVGAVRLCCISWGLLNSLLHFRGDEMRW